MMEKHYKLLLLFQRLYIDNFPLRYKTALQMGAVGGKRLEVKRVDLRFRGTEGYIPLFVLAWLILINVWTFKIFYFQLQKPYNDPRMWGWGLAPLLALFEIILYYTWIIKYQEETISIFNYAFKTEQEMKEELKVPLVFNGKDGFSVNPGILLFLRFGLWASLFFLPIMVAFQEAMGYNPQLYLNKHLAKLFPTISSTLIKLFPFYKQPAFGFLCFLGRWLITVIHYYETARFFGFLFLAAFCTYHTGFSYIWLIQKLLDKHKKGVKDLSYWRHRLYYSGIHIGIQTVEEPIKLSLSMTFVCSVTTMIMATYLPVKLHSSIELYLVIGYGLCSAFLFLFITIVLKGTEKVYEATVSLLDQFKETEMILGMGDRERKIVRRQVLGMKAVTLPIGLGFSTFCLVKTGIKTDVSGYIVDQVISMLLTF